MDNVNEFLDSLTLGEVEFYETYTGDGIGEVYDNGLVGKSTIALYTILQRRTRPDFKVEEAKNIKTMEAYDALKAFNNPKVTPEA